MAEENKEFTQDFKVVTYNNHIVIPCWSFTEALE
jgi:hypothetical protein